MNAGTPASRSDPDQNYGAAMRDAIAVQWSGVWKAVPEVIAGEDPEAVHKVRVASRRLRAAMDVATDCFPGKWYRPLHKTAKEVTRALGDVRDRDVLLEELARERERASVIERPGIDYLIASVERDRRKARKRMVRFLKRLDDEGVPRTTKRRFPPPKGAKAGRPGRSSNHPETGNAKGVPPAIAGGGRQNGEASETLP